MVLVGVQTTFGWDHQSLSVWAANITTGSWEQSNDTASQRFKHVVRDVQNVLSESSYLLLARERTFAKHKCWLL